MCSITDPAVKMQTFELTFENIQLGAWTPDEWHKFTHKLFAFHPKVNAIVEMKVEGLCQTAPSPPKKKQNKTKKQNFDGHVHKFFPVCCCTVGHFESD